MKFGTYLLAVFAVVLSAQMVAAYAPAKSLRPEARPNLNATAAPELATFVRPRARPSQNVAVVTRVAAISTLSGYTTLAVARSLRPENRPDNFTLIMGNAKNARAQGRKGSVCGVNGIKGQNISSIPGKLRGCGVKNPVKVTSVDGVALSTASIMDCGTAKALNKWIKRGAKPAVGNTGGGIASLKVVAHYSCRTRNNQRGAKISEHGKGRAIDIAAIVLKNGEAITVLNGWRKRVHGKILKKMHKAACGPFGTVLGPNANKFHQDHFHFDTARYRSGSYCK